MTVNLHGAGSPQQPDTLEFVKALRPVALSHNLSRIADLLVRRAAVHLDA